ncbi:MAG: hypothetical protein M3273_09095, partial [Actinomycetota bacterium]|nr:hypothetical protein [Actinomycetota bacterium]
PDGAAATPTAGAPSVETGRSENPGKVERTRKGGGERKPGEGLRGSAGGDDGAGADAPGGGGDGSALYPGEGDFVYDQKGWEKFCQGPSCDRRPLPDSQTVAATIESRSDAAATIVAEARSSERQKMTTTTRYSRGEIEITKVVIDFTYGSFNFSQTYEPRPPVESFVFPLSVGKKWSGEWEAQTSGDYRMSVEGRDDVAVGDATARAFRVDTVTNFRGEFSGRAQITVWLDPATRTIVRTDGDIAVASSFGEYTSSFRTTLRSGPGY